MKLQKLLEVRDIWNCKSSIVNCSAKTVKKLAVALYCKMEDLMRLDNEKVGCRDKDFLAKSEYFETMINSNSKIIVYALEPLPKSFKMDLVSSFDDMDP